MSGIVYAAKKKEIAVSVDCPEDLTVSHDSKWTSEALFNLLFVYFFLTIEALEDSSLIAFGNALASVGHFDGRAGHTHFRQ